MPTPEELIRQIAALPTPYDGIDPNDEAAVEAAEDAITGDDERDAAVDLWNLIIEARALCAPVESS